jgi:hypothetical protein
MLVWLHPRVIGANFVLILDNGREKHTCANIIFLKTKKIRKVETFDDLGEPWITSFTRTYMKEPLIQIETIKLRNRLKALY